MTPRIANALKLIPAGYKAMSAVEASIRESGLEKKLLYLVKMRASRINHCAFCIHMHATEARAIGETEMRLYMLNAWRECPLYSERERAALAWTEAVTLVAQTHVPDAVHDEARAQFSEEELVKLTLLVAIINAWNRIAISFRSVHPVEAARAA